VLTAACEATGGRPGSMSAPSRQCGDLFNRSILIGDGY
jgi:hypothetical protein